MRRKQKEDEQVDLEVMSGSEEERIAREKVIAEAKTQFNNLVEQWGETIFQFYYINDKELKINLGLHLDGTAKAIKVRTTMSFATAKVTAETESEVSLQPVLPGV